MTGSTELSDALRGAFAADSPIALATVVEGAPIGAKMAVTPDGHTVGTLGDATLDSVVRRDSLGALADGMSGMRHYGAHGEAREATVSVFIEAFVASPHLIIFGAVDFTGALVRAAKLLGFRVTVCDARAVFATPARFPEADVVVNEWPDRYLAEVGAGLGPSDAVCVLTHDNKFDVPAIIAALDTEVGYLGAMGSRRTHDKRLAQLHEQGIEASDLDRLMAPIGLDIGARTPQETAVAICAEIIACRTGRSAGSLRDGTGPIH